MPNDVRKGAKIVPIAGPQIDQELRREPFIGPLESAPLSPEGARVVPPEVLERTVELEKCKTSDRVSVRLDPEAEKAQPHPEHPLNFFSEIRQIIPHVELLAKLGRDGGAFVGRVVPEGLGHGADENCEHTENQKESDLIFETH